MKKAERQAKEEKIRDSMNKQRINRKVVRNQRKYNERKGKVEKAESTDGTKETQRYNTKE
jgi:hypothetical protein